MRKIGTLIVVMTAAVVLAGCTGIAETSEPASTPSASTSGSIFPDSSTFTPAPQGAIDEDSGETHGPRTVPTWDDSSRQSAVAAAQTVMLAYARPNLGFDEWWANLQPLLDQKATQDYAYMDPSRIVATTITGAPVITDETSAYVAYVDVPTNAGRYGLILSRVDGDSPWLTSRFILPDGVN